MPALAAAFEAEPTTIDFCVFARTFHQDVRRLPVIDGLQQAPDHRVEQVFKLGHFLEGNQFDLDEAGALLAQ